MSEQPNVVPGETPETKTQREAPLSGFLHHQVNAAQETVRAFQALIPPDFRAHSREARREFLLSFKVLLDGALEAVEREVHKAHTSEKPSEASDMGSDRPSTTGKSKVKVEVT